uniref:Uncharacterized protein n=1 Tax=Timema poppense TaxID=170557 RepID=A0A7R9H330_TIMPO|nr:unnamed protein product [Timema poppensis]
MLYSCSEKAKAFYSGCIPYLEKLTASLQQLKLFEWVRLHEQVTWEKVLASYEAFKDTIGSTVDEDDYWDTNGINGSLGGYPEIPQWFDAQPTTIPLPASSKGGGAHYSPYRGSFHICTASATGRSRRHLIIEVVKAMPPAVNSSTPPHLPVHLFKTTTTVGRNGQRALFKESIERFGYNE